VRGVDVLDQFGGALFGQQIDVEEGADAGAVGGNLRLFQPGAVGVAEEIVARLDGVVDAGQVDADGGARTRWAPPSGWWHCPVPSP
jgi:hypothetical protein